jgi:hypothetical protein
MIRAATRLYGKWRELAHQGMTQSDAGGASKYFDARAIGLLVSIAPMAPLMISDALGVQRGWLWYSWAAIAAGWFLLASFVIMRVAVRGAADAIREWRRNRRSK